MKGLYCMIILGKHSLNIVPQRTGLLSLEKKHNLCFKYYLSLFRKMVGSEHFPPPAEILKKANFFHSIQNWLALPSLGAGCVQRSASSGEPCLEKHCLRGTGEN